MAATAGAAANTVRYHMAIAAAAELSIRDDHRNASRTPRLTRITPPGLQNLHDTLALHKAEGRLPSSSSPSARERALAQWMTRRRQDHDRGTLSPTYSEGLQKIPNWEKRTRKDKDEARWNDRLIELTGHMAAGNDWPRHKRTDTEDGNPLAVRYDDPCVSQKLLDLVRNGIFIRPSKMDWELSILYLHQRPPFCPAGPCRSDAIAYPPAFARCSSLRPLPFAY